MPVQESMNFARLNSNITMTELNLLAQSYTFRDLDPRLLDRLLEDGERRVLIDGDVLFRADQPYTEEIYIVIDGEVGRQRQ